MNEYLWLYRLLGIKITMIVCIIDEEFVNLWYSIAIK